MALRFDRWKRALFLRSDLPTGRSGTPTMQQGLDVSQKKIITPIYALLPRFTLEQQVPPHSRLPLITYLI